jgi:hypothetical protein
MDARPANAASTMDDAKAAEFNALPRHMDAHNTTRGQYSGAAIDTAGSSKKVMTAEAKDVRRVYYG